MLTVLSLGGSIVAPEQPDTSFLIDFKNLIERLLTEDAKRLFIIIVGGGGPARVWQQAYLKVLPGAENDTADWIGIMATRLNAQLIKAIFGNLASDALVTDPSADISFQGRILVGAGWKPGFSTDYDAVLLAERFAARNLINLSNIEQVYTDDPKKNPAAEPIEYISWKDFRSLVGDTWVPGKNVPFDPVASRRAADIDLQVICAAGKDLKNLEAILRGDAFFGTTIGRRSI